MIRQWFDFWARVGVGCVVILAMVAVGGPAGAYARTFSSPGSVPEGEYKFVENPDGTWTEYYGTSDPTAPLHGDTYSEAGMEEASRVASEMAIETGTSGQPASIVAGASAENEYASERVLSELRTGKPYATAGEATVGDEEIAVGIGAKVLPTLGRIGTALIKVNQLAFAAEVGLGLSEGIDDLLELPRLGLFIPVSSPVAAPKTGEWISEFGGPVELGEVGPCNGLRELRAPHNPTVNLDPGEELCDFPGVAYEGFWEYKEGKEEAREGVCTGMEGPDEEGVSGGIYFGLLPEGECGRELVPQECPRATTIWVHCESEFAGPYPEYNYIYRRLWAPLFPTIKYAGYPASGLGSYQKGVDKSGATIPAAAPIPTPLTPPTPNELPPPLKHKIIHKAPRKTKKEGETPLPLIPPIEPGPDELPEVDWPVVPTVEPNELYTDYAKRVEESGFVTPEEHVLPELDISPEVGPNEVPKNGVTPSPGTRTPPSTKLKVNVNPANAPEPTEGGRTPIGPPAEPGFDLPNFGVLCEGFPFGVPCWLAATIEAWSTTKAAPKWGIESFTVEGHTIPGATVDLAKLEPIMEVVRPAMVVFATIGLVLLFYRFAKGGSPPSGDGGDSISGG